MPIASDYKWLGARAQAAKLQRLECKLKLGEAPASAHAHLAQIEDFGGKRAQWLMVAAGAKRRGFHSTVAKGRQDAAGVARLPAEFHALTGGAKHASLTGSALEQSPGYKNDAVHEQAELWWDDGRAMIEPVFDADHIPLAEANKMFACGMAFFGAILTIQWLRDPAGNRPTIPRDMPNSDIWERNQYEVSAAFAAANSAADAEEEDDE